MNNKFFFALAELFLGHGPVLVACMQYEGHYPPQRRWQIPISSKQEAIVDTLFRESVGLLGESCAQQENYCLNNVLLERAGQYKNIGEQRYFKDVLYRSVAKIFLISQVSRLKDPAEIISMYITEQECVYYKPISLPVITTHDEIRARERIRQAIKDYDNPEQLPKRLKSTT